MTTPTPPTPPQPKIRIPDSGLVVYRGTAGGQVIVFTHGVKFRSGAATQSGVEGIATVCAEWFTSAAGPRTQLSSTYTIEDVTCIGLGDQASATVVPAGTRTGAQTGAAAVLSAAAVVSLKTGVRGRHGQGRIYHGPMSTLAFNPSGIEVAAVTANDTGVAWRALPARLAAAPSPADLAVLSRKYLQSNIVTGITVRSRVGTQRGRLR